MARLRSQPPRRPANDMSSAMTAVNPAPATWNHLPDELLLEVFKHLLQMARPVSNRTHPIHVLRILRPVSLVNREFRHLAQEGYYSNGVHLVRERNRRTSETYFSMRYPDSSVALFVKVMQLDIVVDDLFDFCPSSTTGAIINKNDHINHWFSIFYTEKANKKYDKDHTKWQLTFTALKKLDVIIFIEGPRDDDGDADEIQPARCLRYARTGTTMANGVPVHARIPPQTMIEQVTKDAKVRFCPETVNVKVSGFARDEEDGAECSLRCTQEVANAVLDVFKRRKLE